MLQLQNPFQPMKLERLAKRLITHDIKPTVKAIKEGSRLYRMDDKLMGELPIFFEAISSLPRIFPKVWFYSNGQYYCANDESQKTFTSLRCFFGINLAMLGHIFIPGAQLTPLFGGKMLNSESTTRDVGWNIIHLIESQKIGQEFLSEINVKFSKN